MADHNVKVEYQYFYTKKEWTTPEGEPKSQREPRITVCYLRTKDCTAVGVAICGPGDNPCRRTGKKIANQRAQHALGLATERENPSPHTVLSSHPIQRCEAFETYFDYSDIDVPKWIEDGQIGMKVRYYTGKPNYRMKRLSN